MLQRLLVLTRSISSAALFIRPGRMPLSYSAAARGTNGANMTPSSSSASSPAAATKQQQSRGPPSNQDQTPRQAPSSTTSQTGSASTHHEPYTSATYARRPEHQPGSSPSPSSPPARGGRRNHHAEPQVHVLTLLESPAHHAALTAQRAAHFPSHLNKLDAHIALFRALPAAELPRITADISALCACTAPFPVATARAFRLRQGVGVGVDSGAREAKAVYEKLRGGWAELGWLSEQDRGGFRAHYTVQNKESEEVKVVAALADVSEWCQTEGSRGTAEGLVLWRYDRGFWKDAKEFRFGKA